MIAMINDVVKLAAHIFLVVIFWLVIALFLFLEVMVRASYLGG
jgi:hypothetical protein